MLWQKVGGNKSANTSVEKLDVMLNKVDKTLYSALRSIFCVFKYKRM